MSILETPTAPPRSRPRRRSAGGWALVALGLVVALVLVAGLAAALLGVLARTYRSGGERVSGVSSIDVRNGCAGDVDVRPGAAGSAVDVGWSDRWSLVPPRHRQELTDGVLVVAVDCPAVSLGWSPSSDLSVTVPQGAPVRVSASAGDVDAEALTGAAELTTGVGDITVDGAGAGLLAGTRTGDVTLERLTGAGEVRVDTGVGDVELTAAEAPRGITVDTGVGDVTVVLPGGTGYDIRHDVGTGAARIDVLDDPASALTMDFDVGVGDVSVRAAG